MAPRIPGVLLVAVSLSACSPLVGELAVAGASKALDKAAESAHQPPAVPFQSDPPILTFGLVRLGHTQVKAIEITNPTRKQIQITSVKITGDGYKLDDPALPMPNLWPGTSFVVNIRFAPTQERTYFAKLIVGFESLEPKKQVFDVSGGGTR